MNTEELTQSTTRESADAALWAVVIHGPEGPGYGFELTSRSIGRCEFLSDKAMSERHAICRRSGAAVWLSDADSSHGTWVDGRRLAPGHEIEVVPGAVIRMGRTVMVCQRGAPGRFDPGAILPGRSTIAREFNALAVERARGRHGMSADIRSRKRRPDHLLILGATGTGKEYIARRMHREAERAGLHVEVNCSTLSGDLGFAELFGVAPRAATGVDASAGRIAEANRGTLFLDEAGDLPAKMQIKLLRFLDNGEFNALKGPKRSSTAWVIAATNVDIHTAINAGRFRSDLYYRLIQYGRELKVPTLQARKVDLGDWMALLAPAGQVRSAALVEACALYDWPGNLRLLASVLMDLPMKADVKHLPPEIRDAMHAPSVGASVRTRRTGRPGRDEVIDALRQTGGEVSPAADLLGVGRRQMYHLRDAYGLNFADYRAKPPSGQARVSDPEHGAGAERSTDEVPTDEETPTTDQ